MERTFIILKPCAVKRNLVGKIIEIFEKKNIKIKEMVMKQASRITALEHYIQHKEKKFYDEIVDHLISGPAVFIVLEGEKAITVVRKLIGSPMLTEAGLGT